MGMSRNSWTVLSMLEWATGFFEKRNVPSPRLSIEWLLADLLDVRRLDLYLLFDRPLSRSELDRLKPLILRRGDHEPLQYITGHADFLDCRIGVNPSVLIPRQETEQLAESLLRDLQGREDVALNVLDLGTGSGCIPIAIKRKRPRWHCTGVDSSETALKTAAKNARENGVEIRLVQANILTLADEEVPGGKFDVIISNPPYITPGEIDSVEPEVHRFEPQEALFHSDPVRLYEAILDFASIRLVDGGRLYLECNPLQVEDIRLKAKERFGQVEVRIDLDGRKRFLVIIRED